MSPEPAARSSHDPSDAEPPSTGGGGPPYATTFRISEAITTARQRRTVAILLSIYLFVLLLLPEAHKFIEVLGVKPEAASAYRGIPTLGLAVILAHLCGLMADAGRIARSIDSDIEIGFDTGDKFSTSLVLGDGIEEGDLFSDSRGNSAKLPKRAYVLVRFADRFVAHAVLLILVAAAFWRVYHEAFELAPWAHVSKLGDRAFGWLIIVLGSLAAFRLLEYWFIRLHGALEIPPKIAFSRLAWEPLPAVPVSITGLLVYCWSLASYAIRKFVFHPIYKLAGGKPLTRLQRAENRLANESRQYRKLLDDFK